MSRAKDLFDRARAEGVAAIDEFIANRVSEEMFLDFKRSSTDGDGRRLRDNDRNNLARAISGFGNSAGGLLVWGVDCSLAGDGADVARAKVPIVDAPRFRSWLEGAVAGLTYPPHQGVEHHSIIGDRPPAGYVLTHIPQSEHAPHQMVSKQQYYIRAGSNFVPTPHDVLAGMFGRRPRPNAYHNYAIPPPFLDGNKMVMHLGFMIHNEGPGIAEDLYATLEVQSLFGSTCALRIEGVDSNDWRQTWTLNRHLSIISKGSVKLPPGGFMQPFVIVLSVAPPFEKPLIIDGYAGASASPRHPVHLECAANVAATTFAEFLQESQCRQIPATDGAQFTSRMFGMPNER